MLKDECLCLSVVMEQHILLYVNEHDAPMGYSHGWSQHFLLWVYRASKKKLYSAQQSARLRRLQLARRSETAALSPLQVKGDYTTATHATAHQYHASVAQSVNL
jgi:hypothetical protein